MRYLITFICVAVTAMTFFNAGCYAPTPKKCPPGQTVNNCTIMGVCKCSGATEVKKLQVCATEEKYASLEVWNHRIDSSWSMSHNIDVRCFDSGSPFFTQDLAPEQSTKPLAWGDDQCKGCVSANCGPQAYSCFQETAGCHCLEQCQVGDTVALGNDLAACGCVQATSAIYEDLRACVNALCIESCYPPVDTCSCN